MSLNTNGLRGAILDRLPFSEADLRSGGGYSALTGLAREVVAEVKRGTVDVSLSASGASTNTVQTPGSYTGNASATRSGSINGLSKSRLTRNLRSAWATSSLTPADTRRDVERVADATATGVVDEISDNGRCTVSTKDSGTVLANGGTVDGSGSGTGTVVNLDATRLANGIKARMQDLFGRYPDAPAEEPAAAEPEGDVIGLQDGETRLVTITWAEGPADTILLRISQGFPSYDPARTRVHGTTQIFDSGFKTSPRRLELTRGSLGDDTIESHRIEWQRVAAPAPAAAPTGEVARFDEGGTGQAIDALAQGVVRYIHSNAEVSVETDLSSLTALPSGGTLTGTTSDDDASIS